MSDRGPRLYDSRWGWLLLGGIAWKLGRKPSRRRAAIALFFDPLGYLSDYRAARALTEVEQASARPADPEVAREN